MDTAGPELPPPLISAASKRQAMDWSLVLASQEIPTTIVQDPEIGWALMVEPRDHDRARAAIRQYHLENRHWNWQQPVPWSEAMFHWGALPWCVLLMAFYWLTVTQQPELRILGRFDSAAAAKGEWWRAFTAILLHADLRHLMSNATIGFLLLGLAMARYRAGLGLFASYLAGAAGNLAGLLLYPDPYLGVGASGMIMGALGLITVSPSLHWPPRADTLKRIVQALFAGVLLFVLLGANPASDVIAHGGGFVAGAFLGVVLNLLPKGVLQHTGFQTIVWLAFAALFWTTLWLAFA